MENDTTLRKNAMDIVPAEVIEILSSDDEGDM